VKGLSSGNFTVLWAAVLSTFVGALRVTPRDQIPVLESLSIEGVTGLGYDLWVDLLKIVGPSLRSVSAFQSRSLSGLQFVASIAEHCPMAERIRLPSLWGASNLADPAIGGIDEEELYDAISELMELELSAPYCAIAALRAWTDFSFCFQRRCDLFRPRSSVQLGNPFRIWTYDGANSGVLFLFIFYRHHRSISRVTGAD
jgi:hypothetical protein